MDSTNISQMPHKENRFKKILLALLPFWDPLIPPMGLSCLKSFLVKEGYDVKVIDVNTVMDFKEKYDRYFEYLREAIPKENRSNFLNIGKDVLRNHMMAHIHFKDKERYIQLVKILVQKTFFHEITDEQAIGLIQLLDQYFKDLKDYFLKVLADEKPDVLGVSVFKGTVAPSLFALNLAKESNPQIMTVMGGGIFADQLAIGAPDWEYFLEVTPYIDHIIIGEGEYLFLKLLRGELQPLKRIYSLEDIDKKILDINSSLIPDFSDFDLQHYPYLASYTSRSCPFQCSFCSETVRWGKYRKKNVKRVVEELKELNRIYHSQLFLLTDSLLNPVVTDLAKEIEIADFSVYWDGYLRVDKHVCDLDTTLSWRRGGFYRARLGVESGSPRILKMMEKKITVSQIKKALSNLAHSGIKTTTYWVIGYPGETEEDFQQTLDLVAELKNDIYEAEFNAFWYFASGQVSSNEWAANSSLLYPEDSKDMLVFKTRIVDGEEYRKITYDRMRRFKELCTKLEIPNPYSLLDIYEADERWERLHKNSVPSLLELKSKTIKNDEAKNVKAFFVAQDIQQDDDDWNF